MCPVADGFGEGVGGGRAGRGRGDRGRGRQHAGALRERAGGGFTASGGNGAGGFGGEREPEKGGATGVGRGAEFFLRAALAKTEHVRSRHRQKKRRASGPQTGGGQGSAGRQATIDVGRHG